jgi:hypothetical protein
MLDWLRTQDSPRPWLDTGAGTRACAFYERRGWVATATLASGEIRYQRPDWPPTGSPMPEPDPGSAAMT